MLRLGNVRIFLPLLFDDMNIYNPSDTDSMDLADNSNSKPRQSQAERKMVGRNTRLHPPQDSSSRSYGSTTSIFSGASDFRTGDISVTVNATGPGDNLIDGMPRWFHCIANERY
jgi:hypothetical protein